MSYTFRGEHGSMELIMHANGEITYTEANGNLQSMSIGTNIQSNNYYHLGTYLDSIQVQHC